MNLPSRLIKSRHGVFYYRLQFQVETKRKELRISLQTKDPVIAKNKSFQISAIIIANRTRKNVMAESFDPDDMSSLPRAEADKLDLKKLDIVHPSGVVFNNINSEKDLQLFFKAVDGMQLDLPKNISELNSFPSTLPSINSTATFGTKAKTVNEVMELYVTASSQKLGSKTKYEYGNYQKIFADWIGTYKKNRSFPMASITMADVGFYINYLRSRDKFDNTSQKKIREISDRTIQHKYLASLGSLFQYAQTISAYPKGEIPSHGHKVFTKKDLKRIVNKSKYKSFLDSELSIIFNPDTFLLQEKPADYWLPLIAIFTGGRISELCQLALTDIVDNEGIWSISINDEDYKQIKTEASRRVIPIHPILINLGLLDYIDDAKPFEGMLFPYLSANKFGNYSETPSERFGKYLDKLNIKDKKKVFHSFRSTANGRLKDHGVDEATRCELIGHEYESTNSTNYSERHNLNYMYQILVDKLNYEFIAFDKLKYQKGQFSSSLEHLCNLKAKHGGVNNFV